MAENPKHPDAQQIAGTIKSLEQIIESIKDVATLSYLNEDEGLELLELAVLAVPLYEKFLGRMSQELLGEGMKDSREPQCREIMLAEMLRSGSPQSKLLALKLSRNLPEA